MDSKLNCCPFFLQIKKVFRYLSKYLNDLDDE